MNDRAIEDGNCTRAIFCNLNSHIGDDAPVFKRITPEQQQVIDRTIMRMMDDTYNDDGSIKSEMFIDMEWLPDEFTREMLQETIESMELSTDYTVFISKWNGKGFIEKTGKRSFRKIA